MSPSPKVKSRPGLSQGLAAGMKAEESSLDDRFKRAEALLGGSAPAAPVDKAGSVPQIRAERYTFSMTREDISLIDKMIARVILDTGVRLNKSEVLRLSLIALENVDKATLKALIITLNRLNKRK